MLPSHGRRSLHLARGVVPPFLPHQRECNDVAISHARLPDIAWVSTWDKPFRPRIGGIAMPQPDVVAVYRSGERHDLLFGEHDRGQESRAHFERAKIARYVELARLPQFCEDLFGFRRFRVLVSVVDVRRGRPAVRRAEIQSWIADAGASALFAFASDAPLAGGQSAGA